MTGLHIGISVFQKDQIKLLRINCAAWNTVLLEKLLVSHLVNKFPTLHGKRRVHYRVDKSPPLDIILSPLNPLHQVITLFP
jgi:hypothetical protein